MSESGRVGVAGTEYNEIPEKVYESNLSEIVASKITMRKMQTSNLEIVRNLMKEDIKNRFKTAFNLATIPGSNALLPQSNEPSTVMFHRQSQSADRSTGEII